MNWLRYATTKIALRKGLLRSDIHIAFPPQQAMSTDMQIEPLVKSFLEVATIRGLDIVGIVSDWLYPGQVGQRLVAEKNIDVVVLAGQEVVTADGLGLLVFNIPQEVPQRMPWQECLQHIHQIGGMVVVIKPNRQWVGRLNKIVHEEWAPEGIEVYNPHFTEYIDINADPEYEFFMTSAADKPNDLLDTKINTQTSRDWWVKNNIMTQDTGKDYMPEYLKDPYRPKGAYLQ